MGEDISISHLSQDKLGIIRMSPKILPIRENRLALASICSTHY